MSTFKTTPNEITSLKHNEVFVFGSNTKGIHGKGAALLAKQKFGAIEGMAFGHQGQSFAIPTKDGTSFAKRSVSLTDIKSYLKTFLVYAIDHPKLEFLVTRIGCGLSGYSDSEIANLFRGLNIPNNVALPVTFVNYLHKEEPNMSTFKMVEAGKNSRLTLVNLYDFLKENPITYKEALFLGWVSLEDGYSKVKRDEPKKHTSIITKLDIDDAEVALSKPISPARMVAGLNYLNYLKSIKGSILPPDFEEALVKKQLKVTSKAHKLIQYICTWFPGYSFESSIVEPSELEECSNPCLCDNNPELLPESYDGKIFNSGDFVKWWMLPSDAPFHQMLLASSTGYDKDKSAFQINNHTWVNWNSEEAIITFVTKQRISRSVYTIRGIDNFFAEDPMLVWGNFLIQFVMKGGTEDYLSLLINRDCTDLLTPSVVYGDVSPLNHSVNHDTVGNLVTHLNGYSDGCTIGFDFRNDKEAYAPVEAATIAMQKGYPVLFQHQLEKVRIGKGAQALGKSTLKVYIKLDKETFIEGKQYPAGTLVPVDLILGQDEVDKAAKLFNRDALCVRVTPGVKIIFPEGFLTEEGEDIAKEMEDFASSLLAD